MDKLFYSKTKANIPPLSGVYIFKDARRRPLYVGKASNLSNRLNSYFTGAKVPMIAQMLKKASSIEWQTTLTEIEALILESQLIKKLKPPYNTLLRDDKQYFYVGFTHEQFSKIIITHQVGKQATSKRVNRKKSDLSLVRLSLVADFVGPFTNGGALRMALKNLRRIFPYCTCKQKHQRPCLNYHIGNCLGFCCLKIDNEFSRPRESIVNYKSNIRAIREILNGKKTAVVKKLIRKLKEKENSADTENSAQLRNQIIKLERFFQNTKVIQKLGMNRKILLELKKILNLPTLPKRIEGYDISNIGGLFATGSMIVFTDGLPDKNEYRKFKIKSVTGSNDVAMLSEVLERRLRHTEWQYPDLILVDGGRSQVNAVSLVLKTLYPKPFTLDPIPVIGITKNTRHIGEQITLLNGEEISLNSIPDPVKNLLLQIDAEAHRFAISYYHKRHSFR